jgi:hypothetical protein
MRGRLQDPILLWNTMASMNQLAPAPTFAGPPMSRPIPSAGVVDGPGRW